MKGTKPTRPTLDRKEFVTSLWLLIKSLTELSKVQMIREGFRESVEELGGCCQSQAVKKGSMKMYF